MNIDPLEDMLHGIPENLTPGKIEEMHKRAVIYLDRLEEKLDNPPPPPQKLSFDSKQPGAGLHPLLNFDAADLPRAQELFKRLALAGGTSNSYEQRHMLRMMGATPDVASIPFWLEMLGFTPRPREQFAQERREYALAALAIITLAGNEQEGTVALLKATEHTKPDVRAGAIYYLSEAYLASEKEIPPATAARLRQVALDDPDFAPRFQARDALRGAGLPVPIDVPDGVYAFKVTLEWAPEVPRVVEVRSTQTLQDLHTAIQRAFGWDDDHLYSFYMTGKMYDRRYGIPCTDMEDPFSMFASGSSGSENEEGEQEEDEPLYAYNTVIGELGLGKGHKFIYFFDYGDSHTFWVEVKDIRPKAERGRYPRVTEKAGKNPPQYPDWDEDEGEPEE